MKARVNKVGVNIRFLQLTVAMIILSLVAACASMPSIPTVRQQDLDAWVGISVEALDTHPFFTTMSMFRTRTDSGTEIRNYAYNYDFRECFAKVGANNFGDFVNEKVFIICSSSRVACNNLFYIKEDEVLEYAPTGRCDTDEKLQPEARDLKLKS